MTAGVMAFLDRDAEAIDAGDHLPTITVHVVCVLLEYAAHLRRRQ